MEIAPKGLYDLIFMDIPMPVTKPTQKKWIWNRVIISILLLTNMRFKELLFYLQDWCAERFFEEVSNDSEIHKLTGNRGCASEKLYQLCDTMVAPEYRSLIRPFLDVSTLSSRLKAEECIHSFFSASASWVSPSFFRRSIILFPISCKHNSLFDISIKTSPLVMKENEFSGGLWLWNRWIFQ